LLFVVGNIHPENSSVLLRFGGNDTNNAGNYFGRISAGRNLKINIFEKFILQVYTATH
jgi:hypothetical protein